MVHLRCRRSDGHYNVNSGVPKTLIQHLIRWVISSGQFSDDVSQTLRAIIAAEISPELVPVDEGQKPQSTEAAIGPYALQDFSLFHTLRFGFRPPRSPLWQCTPGKKIRQPIGRWVCRTSSDTIANWPISGNGWKSFCGGFLPSVSSNVPQCRTARRSQQVVRCHRGAIGGRRPTAMLRRGWKILSATCRIKLDSLGGHKRAGQVTVIRSPGLSTGSPPTGRRKRCDVLPASGGPAAGALPHEISRMPNRALGP